MIICNLCGHDADYHHFENNKIYCSKCPNRKCQDGLDGQRHREELNA